jgi:tRNA G18 (ribose-2'-O)-methylase SpoU
MKFRLLALTPDPAATPIGQIEADGKANGKLALLIGGEGDGLSARWLAAADQAVRIPMSSTSTPSTSPQPRPWPATC